jgi:hypothetical protein
LETEARVAAWMLLIQISDHSNGVTWMSWKIPLTSIIRRCKLVPHLRSCYLSLTPAALSTSSRSKNMSGSSTSGTIAKNLHHRRNKGRF